ncbi:haloacid dehalogenase, type II [Kwoniella shandongensis]|uniref:Haloacid dehalogenase, type II n=1 Tax=Kwoniella shandongensis TaxID=1734106 RepID=A0A5M6BYW8_9TREE|nr:haloacid dehalogenase, type II [Kwoniella shandongensis]KAA5526159.1 haloacid dehalogenase, type II [Kwoniella shandongensis]
MSSQTTIPTSLKFVKSLTFDLMGTCADYTTALLADLAYTTIPPSIDHEQLIKAWRAGFFEMIFELHAKGEEKSVDEVHRLVLDRLLDERGVGLDVVDEEERERLVMGWHRQVAWPDAIEGIQRLKTKYDCVVVANGTTRLQLDIASSSHLPFHALFSSQLIGYTKPDPRMYRRAIELLARKPEEVAMVAAHAYDLRAAKAIGMRTIYIQRDTEDPDEEMALIRSEVDLFIDGRLWVGTKGGMNELAGILGCEVRPMS